MRRRTLMWLAAVAAVSVLVAVQVVSTARHSEQSVGAPILRAGTDVLAGVTVVAARVRGHDYLRVAFGAAWDDDNGAPGGGNRCDTRNDILNRDLLDKTHVSTKRCPQAVASGTLRDPYTNATVGFVRGNQVGASVQIAEVLRGYRLPIDEASARELRNAAASCPSS